MAIDTGAMYSLIRPADAEWLGLDIGSESREMTIFSATGSVKAPLLIIQSVQLEYLVVEEAKAVCLKLPSYLGFDGIIGLDLLKRFNLYFDFKKHLVIFE